MPARNTPESIFLCRVMYEDIKKADRTTTGLIFKDMMEFKSGIDCPDYITNGHCSADFNYCSWHIYQDTDKINRLTKVKKTLPLKHEVKKNDKVLISNAIILQGKKKAFR